EMVMQFPCGNRERQWGVLPLTRLFSNVRGLNYPGSIFNRDVERPDWMRIAFLGLPEDTDIRLYSMKGKLLGAGKAIRGEAKKGPALQTVLTFRPSQEEDQLVLFITPQNAVLGGGTRRKQSGAQQMRLCPRLVEAIGGKAQVYLNSSFSSSSSSKHGVAHALRQLNLPRAR